MSKLKYIAAFLLFVSLPALASQVNTGQGTLGTSSGGTGTTNTFTQGSVVFAGASGIYTQDNAKFNWIDANYQLNIGTTTSLTPVGGITQQANTATAFSSSAPQNTAFLYVYNADTTSTDGEGLCLKQNTTGTTALSCITNIPSGTTGTSNFIISTRSGVTISTAVTVASANTTFAGTVSVHGYTVGTLPTGQTSGTISYVTDQTTTCAVAGAALTGGGSVTCPVFYNGSAWVGM